MLIFAYVLFGGPNRCLWGLGFRVLGLKAGFRILLKGSRGIL